MTSEIVHPFAGENQNNSGLIVRTGTSFTHETRSITGVSLPAFLQDVEIAVCSKINEMSFRSDDEGVYAPSLTPVALASKSQKRALTLARKWCCFIAALHPKGKGQILRSDLGRRYRRDHSTVSYYIGDVAAQLVDAPNHENSQRFAAICAHLSRQHGPFDFSEAAKVESMRSK